MIKLRNNFSSCKTGKLTEKSLGKIFGVKDVFFPSGLKTRLKLMILPGTKYVEIYLFENEPVLKVNLFRNKFGPFVGSHWKISFTEKTDTATLSYKVLFQDGFNFTKGGKLPGLAGGTGNTGGLVPNGYDGWSVRFMFKEKGSICAYMYYPKMEEKYGEKRFLSDDNGLIYLKTGRWNNITLTLKMNEPEKENGMIISKVNGKEVLMMDSICFRKTDKLKIDHLLFSCFMGGDDISYSPDRDQYLMFKDFEVEY